MVRRGAAIAGVLLFVIVAGLGVRGCLDARKRAAIKDWTGDAAALVRESNAQGTALVELLQGGRRGTDPVQVENELNTLRTESRQLVTRLDDLGRPDELARPYRYLLEVLALRRDAIDRTADQLPLAIGDRGAAQATERIAAEVQTLLAADVLYRVRFLTELRAVLRSEGLADEVALPRSEIIKDLTLLDPARIADGINALRSGGGREQATARPGLHGTGIVTAAIGGQPLSNGGSATVTLRGPLSAQVQVANQGESDEVGVRVRVRIGSGPGASEASARIDRISRGQTATVTVPISREPPTGQQVPVEVRVDPVPGERKTDNNVLRANVIFTR